MEGSNDRSSPVAPPSVGNRAASAGVKRGAWTKEEDSLHRECVETYGEGKWHLVPPRAGLKRCRKSCRLRWLNYLSPKIKRGPFSTDEVDLIVRMHQLLGNRWSLIAGRIPGRTANDVKNYWNTHASKSCSAKPATDSRDAAAVPPRTVVYRPEAQRVSERMREMMSQMYPPREPNLNPPPATSQPLDISPSVPCPLPAPEHSSSNPPWLAEDFHQEELAANAGGGGDLFLDDAQFDDLFCDPLLWDWQKQDDNGSSPLD